MASYYHGNLHDITDSIATMQSLLTQMQNAANNTSNIESNTTPISTIATHASNIDNQTSSTSSNTSSVATNTSSAGAGLNTDNINNKLLTAQKSSQTMGFVGASALSSNFTTTSSTFVDTGISISNVPNSS